MLTAQPLLTTAQGLEAQPEYVLQNQVSAAFFEWLWCDFFSPRENKTQPDAHDNVSLLLFFLHDPKQSSIMEGGGSLAVVGRMWSNSVHRLNNIKARLQQHKGEVFSKRLGTLLTQLLSVMTAPGSLLVLIRRTGGDLRS